MDPRFEMGRAGLVSFFFVGRGWRKDILFWGAWNISSEQVDGPVDEIDLEILI